MLNRITRTILLVVFSLLVFSSTTIAASHHNDHANAPMTTMPMMSMEMPKWDGQLPFDKWFLDNMIPHHQQAIMMSRMLFMHTQRAEMKTLGNDIIQAQMKEIEQMQDWRTQWFHSQPMAMHPDMMKNMTNLMRMDCAGMMSMMPGQMPQMMNMDIDLWFINEMIPHHQGAISMAKMAIENAEHPEIINMAQNIISSQQQEIDKMQQWKKDWYPTAK